MKRIILFLSAILIAVLLGWSISYAAPFLGCDPQVGVTHYRLTGPAWIISPVTAQADGSVRMDVAPSAVGITSVTIAACKNDPVWGELCSSFVPFDYPRPPAPGSPGGIGLQP